MFDIIQTHVSTETDRQTKFEELESHEIKNISKSSHIEQIIIQNLNIFYGKFHALKNISMSIKKNTVTTFIGPSGCGKSTCLKTINRMTDFVPSAKMSGSIMIDGQDIYSPQVDVSLLRKNAGMVFQKPNPFPMSIFDNVAYGLRAHGIRKKHDLNIAIENSLESVGLWDHVKDRLNEPALGLSGGQQQRLCIARALAVSPEILLMDEPTSALDPISTLKIEDLILQLKNQYTFIIVTHNMQQASRISDRTAFFLSGELIEFNDTFSFFNNPKDIRTDQYITGKLG
ncbi:MAG: phosphate ABC transporter ATP-binding protein [Candidatus Improbicoccus devescovinae]|nr:MAG: phosphate ABC transporter ATP-binding protein [Candidatus Improbicoccus devescovinae]